MSDEAPIKTRIVTGARKEIVGEIGTETDKGTQHRGGILVAVNTGTITRAETKENVGIMTEGTRIQTGGGINFFPGEFWGKIDLEEMYNPARFGSQ